MKIYVPQVVEGQEWIMPTEAGGFEALGQLAGNAQRRWQPLPMRLLTSREDGSPRLYSDFPWYGEHALFMRQPALRLLAPHIAAYGEVLDIRCAPPVALFNVTTVVDALDEAHSEIVRFDDGSILTIDRHALRADAIGATAMFKLPERPGGLRLSSIYLQEPLVRLIGALGIQGAAFTEVWNDEGSPAADIVYPAGPGSKAVRSLGEKLRDLVRRR